jgi:hypothetical protein
LSEIKGRPVYFIAEHSLREDEDAKPRSEPAHAAE